MAIPGLSDTQALALLEETTSARILIAYALRVVRSEELTDDVREPVLTMLSIGVEKMYKLTLGVSALDSTGVWPCAATAKAWGHRISSMHEEVIDDFRGRSTTHTSYAAGLIDAVTNDPVVRPVIDALDIYGRRGRFYNLDELGASAQSGKSPRQAWRAIEAAVAMDATVADLSRRAMESPNDSDIWSQHHSACRERIALAVDNIWLMVAVCGRFGLLGQAGRTFGLEVRSSTM